jgi:type II secretory pathway pseudopilin PulG
LVELLVVIAIIGVLIALILPAVQMAREAANTGHAAKVIHAVVNSVEEYYSDIGEAPDNLTSLFDFCKQHPEACVELTAMDGHQDGQVSGYRFYLMPV